MAIFLNWFQIETSSDGFTLPCRRFASWDESSKAHKDMDLVYGTYQRLELRREALSPAPITVLIGEQDTPDGFENTEFNIYQTVPLGNRILEHNLGCFFRNRGYEVRTSRFETTATQDEFHVEDIGFQVACGIGLKPFYSPSERKFGITVNWRVKAQFTKSLADLDVGEDAKGDPVILRLGDAEIDGIAQWNERYVGIIVDWSGDTARVRVRDGSLQSIPMMCLYPEVKPQIINKWGRKSTQRDSHESLHKIMLRMSHTLTDSGRRNNRIMADQLQSALKLLNPEQRIFVSVRMQPFCMGTMRVSGSPAVAKLEHSYNV